MYHRILAHISLINVLPGLQGHACGSFEPVTVRDEPQQQPQISVDASGPHLDQDFFKRSFC